MFVDKASPENVLDQFVVRFPEQPDEVWADVVPVFLPKPCHAVLDRLDEVFDGELVRSGRRVGVGLLQVLVPTLHYGGLT